MLIVRLLLLGSGSVTGTASVAVDGGAQRSHSAIHTNAVHKCHHSEQVHILGL